MLNSKDYQTIISSRHGLLDLKLREVFQYRDLIWLFFKRDFVAAYKQTILGPLWALINPLLTTVVFSIVFGRLAGLTTADVPGEYVIPGFLFYMSGNLCWSYFSGTLGATSNTFISNSGIMGKVYFPRLISPIATAFSHLISFFIQLAMFFAIWAFFLCTGGTDMHASLRLLLVPLLILHMSVLSVGCGIVVSSVTTKYRDLAMLVGFFLRLWQYFSPIAYGLELVNTRAPEYMSLYMLNPVTPIITSFRYAVFGIGYFEPVYYLASWGVSLVIFLIGLILFNRIERTFIDTV